MRASTIKPPATGWHPNRDIECRLALDTAFRRLADRAVAAGWTRPEVAAALLALAWRDLDEQVEDAAPELN